MVTKATKDGQPAVYARTRQDWREWLEAHHATTPSVWLIIYHKKSNMPSVGHDHAVEEALCFGWIDSKPNKRDKESYYLFFAQRKPSSNWSRANRDRVNRMEAAGKMRPAGEALVKLAQESGAWMALEAVQNGVIPDDLQAQLDATPKAREHFMAFPPSTKRGILEWILNAKRPATREKQIRETVELAAQNIRANQYRP